MYKLSLVNKHYNYNILYTLFLLFLSDDKQQSTHCVYVAQASTASLTTTKINASQHIIQWLILVDWCQSTQVKNKKEKNLPCTYIYFTSCSVPFYASTCWWNLKNAKWPTIYKQRVCNMKQKMWMKRKRDRNRYAMNLRLIINTNNAWSDRYTDNCICSWKLKKTIRWRWMKIDEGRQSPSVWLFP